MYNSMNVAALKMSSEQVRMEPTKPDTSPKLNFDADSDNASVFSGTTSKNLIEMSKMRKLEEARKKWEVHHSSNSPFRADKFSASPLLEGKSSPFTISKVYGMRHGFQV